MRTIGIESHGLMIVFGIRSAEVFLFVAAVAIGSDIVETQGRG
jgi:hypothetical protein